MLVGTLVGDALGGPVEFQPPDAVHALPRGPKKWRPGEKLDINAIAEARERFHLRGYAELRPTPEPYGQWATNGPAGTLTDDSRHKMVLAHALRGVASGEESGVLSAGDLARSYLSWGDRPGARGSDAKITEEWLQEVRFAARWTLGERDLRLARPPERLWNGLPTCMGQMTLLPLAAAFPRDAEAAFLAAHNLAFFDNGWGKDLNAGLVAALAVALALPAPDRGHRADTSAHLDAHARAWKSIVAALVETDPYGNAEVPWCERAASRWVRVAKRCVAAARGEPARLFAALDAEFAETTKWEAQVPVVAMLASAEIASYDPLASMQVCIEWGHDTDSYAQLLGAFIGALHGPEVFPSASREAVTERLSIDYGESLREWIDLFTAPIRVTSA